MVYGYLISLLYKSNNTNLSHNTNLKKIVKYSTIRKDYTNLKKIVKYSTIRKDLLLINGRIDF